MELPMINSSNRDRRAAIRIDMPRAPPVIPKGALVRNGTLKR